MTPWSRQLCHNEGPLPNICFSLWYGQAIAKLLSTLALDSSANVLSSLAIACRYQSEKQMFGKGPVPGLPAFACMSNVAFWPLRHLSSPELDAGPAETVSTMNPNADVFIPKAIMTSCCDCMWILTLLARGDAVR